MDSGILDWLSRVGLVTFYWSLGLFVVINGAAALLIASRRNRELVNRWTGRILAVDLMLIGAGVGVPLVAGMAKLAMITVSGPFTSSVTAVEASATSSGTSAMELKRLGQ